MENFTGRDIFNRSAIYLRKFNILERNGVYFKEIQHFEKNSICRK